MNNISRAAGIFSIKNNSFLFMQGSVASAGVNKEWRCRQNGGGHEMAADTTSRRHRHMRMSIENESGSEEWK